MEAKNIIIDQLEANVSKQVTVWVGKSVRNSFDTQLSIAGTLVQHSQDKDSFRVVVNEGTYVYFNTEDVIEFGAYGDKKFKDGSECVIRLEADKVVGTEEADDDDEPTGSCQNPTCRKYLYNEKEYCSSSCEYEHEIHGD